MTSDSCISCNKIILNNSGAITNSSCNHKICENCINTNKRKIISCCSCENKFDKYFVNDNNSTKITKNGINVEKINAIHDKKGQINVGIIQLKEEIKTAVKLMIDDLRKFENDLFDSLDDSNNDFQNKLDVNFYDNKLLSFYKYIESSQNEMKTDADYYKKEMRKFDDFALTFEEHKHQLLSLSKKIKRSSANVLNFNFKIKDLCKLSNNRILILFYRKPFFKIYNEKFHSIFIFDNVTEIKRQNDENNNNTELPSNYVAITSNMKDLIYITSNNSIFMTDYKLNLIKLINDKNKFSYLSSIAYSQVNDSIYVCDCSNKAIHRLNGNLEYVKIYKFIYQPLKIEIINETVCVIPQYDDVEINCLHLYDLNTFNFKFSYNVEHYGPLGVFNSTHFCLYDFENKTLHLIHQNGYLTDNIEIEIDKKKFHLCDRLFDFNERLCITSSLNEKIFYLS